ncbi:hypothetical protein P7K49_009501, partial [Saguinus oedipus]
MADARHQPLTPRTGRFLLSVPDHSHGHELALDKVPMAPSKPNPRLMHHQTKVRGHLSWALIPHATTC